jgi:hypothetical protein
MIVPFVILLWRDIIKKKKYPNEMQINPPFVFTYSIFAKGGIVPPSVFHLPLTSEHHLNISHLAAPTFFSLRQHYNR